MTVYVVGGAIFYEPGPGLDLIAAFVDEQDAEECRNAYEEWGKWDREEDMKLPNGRDAHWYDSFYVYEVPLFSSWPPSVEDTREIDL